MGLGTGARNCRAAATFGACVLPKGGNADVTATGALTAGIAAVWTGRGLEDCVGGGCAANAGPFACDNCPPKFREVVD